MKVFYETNKTHIVAQNKEELLNYLLNVDCNSENPVHYTAKVVKSVDNHYVLVIDVNRFKTSISFPLIIADCVKTDCITKQLDCLETFRYCLKEFLDYIETLKCDTQKDWDKVIKKYTTKEPKTKPAKPAKPKEPDKDEMGCRTYVKMECGVPCAYKQYCYINRGGI